MDSPSAEYESPKVNKNLVVPQVSLAEAVVAARRDKKDAAIREPSILPRAPRETGGSRIYRFFRIVSGHRQSSEGQ